MGVVSALRAWSVAYGRGFCMGMASCVWAWSTMCRHDQLDVEVISFVWA